MNFRHFVVLFLLLFTWVSIQKLHCFYLWKHFSPSLGFWIHTGYSAFAQDINNLWQAGNGVTPVCTWALENTASCFPAGLSVSLLCIYTEPLEKSQCCWSAHGVECQGMWEVGWHNVPAFRRVWFSWPFSPYSRGLCVVPHWLAVSPH